MVKLSLCGPVAWEVFSAVVFRHGRKQPKFIANDMIACLAIEFRYYYL